MRTLALNELQFVSGGGDLPSAPEVYTTGDMLNALQNNPPPIGIGIAVFEMYYNFTAAVQFGLTSLIWGIHQLGC